MGVYRLILVDDEALVRRNIIEKIKWKDYGFEVVGQAENGSEALELVEAVKPDVVIADIEMPFINGLELSRVLRERFPMTKIVLLTGYDEFKYAQEAIKLNVLDYILKPVSSKELVSLLNNLKEQLDAEIAQIEDLKALKKYYEDSLPVLKANFFRSAVRGRLDEEELRARAKHLEVDLTGNLYGIIVVSIDKSARSNRGSSQCDFELSKMAVQNAAERIVSRRYQGYPFCYDDYVVVLCRTEKTEKTSFLRDLFRLSEEMKQTMEKYLMLQVVIGIGKLCREIGCLADAFDSALTALDYRSIAGNDKPIYISDMEPRIHQKIAFYEKNKQLLMTSFRLGLKSQLMDTLDLVFSEIPHANASLKDYQIYLMEVLSSIVAISRDLNISTGSIMNGNNNVFIELLSFDHIDEVKNWFKNICLNLMEQITVNRQKSCKIIVKAAEQYILENYSDCDLSMNGISNFLHISPSYFGYIFKNETGETFLNFLTKTRMEKAKALMGSTNMKNMEIAKNVGYNDQHYFSYSFKKYYGKSPKEYRNELINS